MKCSPNPPLSVSQSMDTDVDDPPIARPLRRRRVRTRRSAACRTWSIRSAVPRVARSSTGRRRRAGRLHPPGRQIILIPLASRTSPAGSTVACRNCCRTRRPLGRFGRPVTSPLPPWERLGNEHALPPPPISNLKSLAQTVHAALSRLAATAIWLLMCYFQQAHHAARSPSCWPSPKKPPSNASPGRCATFEPSCANPPAPPSGSSAAQCWHQPRRTSLLDRPQPRHEGVLPAHPQADRQKPSPPPPRRPKLTRHHRRRPQSPARRHDRGRSIRLTVGTNARQTCRVTAAGRSTTPPPAIVHRRIQSG